MIWSFPIGNTVSFPVGNALPCIANMAVQASDLELARLASPGVPDAELIVMLAQRTLRELAMDPPIDHRIIASMRGIARIEQTDIPWAGCLLQEGSDLIVKLRSTDGRRRQRFTAFHEAKHTYFPGFTTVTQYRCDPRTAPPTARDAGLESLCDLGAAELLFPRLPFLADLSGNPPTLDLVEGLAQRYDASIAATALRVVTVRAQPTLLIALEPATKPSDPKAAAVPRIQWVQASGGSWPFVPRHKSVAPDSPLARALAGEIVDEVCDLSGLSTPAITNVRVSANVYPYFDQEGTQHMRVLALVTPHRSHHV